MALVGGLLLAGISAIAFSWVANTWELYAVQAMHAFAFALYFASWPTIFSRHLDKDRISFDWSLDSTAAGMAAGVTGLLSGIIAEFFGYTAVFVAAGLLSFVAAFVLLAVPDLILPRATKKATSMMDHTPADLDV